MSSWCNTCGEYMWFAHVCPPKWLLWSPENGETEEDAREVYGIDPEAAAEAWAERDDRDSGEGSIARGNDAKVRMRYADDPARAERLKLPTGELEALVTGEYLPSYNATYREIAAPRASADQGVK